MKDAVDALLGERSQGDALLEVRIDGKLRAAAPGGAEPPQVEQLGRLAESWLPLRDRDYADSHRDSSAARAGQDGPARRRLDAALPGYAQGQAHWRRRSSA